MENEIEKPESALGFIPNHVKIIDDGNIMKNKFKKMQQAEEQRIKIQEQENARRTAREEKEIQIKTARTRQLDDPEAI